MIDSIRLNIGAGGVEIPGFEPWDISDGRDARQLPHADGSVDEVYASHILEHFGHNESFEVLKEWVRVLKPSGRIRIAVPDFEQLSKMKGDPHLPLYVLGGQTDEYDFHKSLWTRDRLQMALERLGVEEVDDFQPFAHDCSSYPFSLNLSGRKRPRYTIRNKPKVVACMSVGRISFTDTMLCINGCFSMLAPELIAVSYVGTAFYEKSMTLAIEKAIQIDRDIDYILAVDHDSLFTPDDVRVMLEYMQTDDEAAAVYPVQMHRYKPEPLVDRGEYQSDFERVDVGHFGLTLIRAEVFRKMPQPWFWSMPGQDGTWSAPDVLDGDITCWRKLQMHGHKVMRANRVTIGHIELVSLWPQGNGRQFQLLEDYKRNGKPKDAEWRGEQPEPEVVDTFEHGRLAESNGVAQGA